MKTSLWTLGHCDEYFFHHFMTFLNLIQKTADKSLIKVHVSCGPGLHTGVWIIMALWSLMVLTISRGYTGWPHSIRHNAVSMVIRTPVRPIPALEKKKQKHNRVKFRVKKSSSNNTQHSWLKVSTIHSLHFKSPTDQLFPVRFIEGPTFYSILFYI